MVAFAPSAAAGSGEHQRLLSASADRTLRLWDATARRSLKISKKLPAEVTALAVNRWGFRV